MTPQHPYVTGRCNEINTLLADLKVWSQGNDKLGAHLANYLCVVLSGVVEECVENLVAERAKKHQDAELVNYVREVVHKLFSNPEHGTISGLLGQFSPEYKSKFVEKIPHNGKEGTSLTSIVNTKNQIAHGTNKFQLTLRDMEDYYTNVIPILEILEQILLTK
ncbi:MAG: hypothetical protein HY687_00100 [Chloroflexi bacterium]|nr:hypothetical protein [Chloroflexota bacterium]